MKAQFDNLVLFKLVLFESMNGISELVQNMDPQ